MEYFVAVGLILCIIYFILINYDIRYKGKCILHDWEYKFTYGDYWGYTGTFLKENRRYECRKCWKEKKE